MAACLQLEDIKNNLLNYFLTFWSKNNRKTIAKFRGAKQRGKTPLRLGHLAPASEVAGGHTIPF
jgi:hypothetical protein